MSWDYLVDSSRLCKFSSESCLRAIMGALETFECSETLSLIIVASGNLMTRPQETTPKAIIYIYICPFMLTWTMVIWES